MKSLLIILFFISSSIVRAQTFNSDVTYHFNEGKSFNIIMKTDGIDGKFMVYDSVHNEAIIFGDGFGIYYNPIPETLTDATLVHKKYVEDTKSILKELTADPDGVINGYIYYNSQLHKVRVKIGGVWRNLSLE